MPEMGVEKNGNGRADSSITGRRVFALRAINVAFERSYSATASDISLSILRTSGIVLLSTRSKLPAPSKFPRCSHLLSLFFHGKDTFSTLS